MPHYFASGDYLTYYFRDEPCHAERLDELVTVYLSDADDSLVGCKIKGVKHVLDTAGDFGVEVGRGPVKLGFFFFLGASRARDAGKVQRYQDLKKLAKDATIDRSELQPC